MLTKLYAAYVKMYFSWVKLIPFDTVFMAFELKLHNHLSFELVYFQFDPHWINVEMFQLGEDMISFCCDFRAEAVYQSMKSTFGGQNCHLLHINSRSLHTAESMHTDLPDPWSQFLNKNNSEANSVSTGQSKNGQSVLSVYDFISMIECNKKSVKAILGTILILEFLM